ncbi:MAG: hypothetical protein IKJ27_00390 [Clostridia bacterium]|nr:hypothetical protein [Clostridia bacterium]
MKKHTKVLCVAICAVLCASVFFSVWPAAYDHSHDCLGENCQYCQAVSLQQELMRLVLFGCFSTVFAFIFIQLIVNCNLRGDGKKQNVNLVANRVKLTA